ncbi:Stf0 family sulfotransferase [Alteromonas sp. ASW11-130]|uniref:Stf0 family sulfotransferase n=1 Tax=Alteromonas sp. ASW11-130 TaxID=3015775 RepID=UPI002242A5CB|nr:Stf0 family sulfotransferase [Alteromonas sp. ASW11-130]MCW8090397.1 Stf0 sulfotransferase family protein [Alteromonas sp. ASW11-130]
MNYYEEQFQEKFHYPIETNVTKTLIIASTVRSGSHMLGHALHQTGAFGFPLEYVNEKNLERWKSIFNTRALDDTLAQIQKHRTSPNGVFGIKIHYSHLRQLGGFDGLKKLFVNPSFIWLTREDIIAQAVSLSIAKQTGAWISQQNVENEDVTYDAKQIDEGVRRIIFENASWQYALNASASHFLHVNFTDVKNNTASIIRNIADFMQVDIDTSNLPHKPVTKKQSKHINQLWIEKFQKQFDGRTQLISLNNESFFHKLSRKFS